MRREVFPFGDWGTASSIGVDTHRAKDQVERNFTAERSNSLWVSDLTYVANCRDVLSDAFGRRSVRGEQSLSIRYSERLAEAGIEPSVGSRGADTTMRWPRPYSSCTRAR